MNQKPQKREGSFAERVLLMTLISAVVTTAYKYGLSMSAGAATFSFLFNIVIAVAGTYWVDKRPPKKSKP